MQYFMPVNFCFLCDGSLEVVELSEIVNSIYIFMDIYQRNRRGLDLNIPKFSSA